MRPLQLKNTGKNKDNLISVTNITYKQSSKTDKFWAIIILIKF